MPKGHKPTPNAARGTISDNEFMLRVRTRDGVFRILRQLISAVLFGFLAYMAKDSVVALSGQSTSVLVKAGLTFMADSHLTLSYSLTIMVTVWAATERVTRQNQTKRLHQRIEKLEKKIDPERSSSTLTLKGQTNPRDKEI